MLPEESEATSIVASLRDAVLVATLEPDRIVFWNPAATALFGYRLSEALTLGLEALFSEALRPQLATLLAPFRRPGPVLDTVLVVEGHARRRSGTHVPIELLLTPLNVPRFGGQGILAVCRDTSQRLHREQERHRETRLEAARLAIRSLEHYLANALTPVVAYAEMLLADPRLPAELRGWADEAYQCARTAIETVRRMQQLTRLEAADFSGPAGPLLDLDRSTG
jgi:PAS domain S-box-containing protein